MGIKILKMFSPNTFIIIYLFYLKTFTRSMCIPIPKYRSTQNVLLLLLSYRYHRHSLALNQNYVIECLMFDTYAKNKI